MPRVAVGGFSHETNTFSPRPTTYEEFVANGLVRGADLARLAGTRTTAGGFVDGIASDPALELVPTVVCSAIPGGLVTADAVERVEGEILAGIAAVPPDAVLLDLHGAMVTDLSDDGEGHTLRRVREAVGPDVPVLTVLDCHANVTDEMLRNADIILPYDTYPHVDMGERGKEAAALAGRMLRGEIRPVTAMARLPLMAAPPRQHTGAGVGLRIMNRAFEIEQIPGVVNCGVNWGFAYADTPVTGMSVLVTTNDDADLARRLADEFAREIWAMSEEFLPRALTVEEAIHAAMAEPQGPIILADLGDNPGGGTTCDGTALLWGLLDLGAKNATIGVIADPAVVSLAVAAGVGAVIETELGGKVDDLHGYPVPVRATVLRLSDGAFTYEGPMAGGRTDTLGRTAVLRCEGRHGGDVEVIVCERRVQAFDTAVFRSQGIQPEDKHIVVVKSAVHFRGAFTPIAARIIEVDTPGLLAIDLEKFDFQRIGRPIFPLDREGFSAAPWVVTLSR